MDCGEFTDYDLGWGDEADSGQSCPNVMLALRVLRGGRVQCLAQTSDRFVFGSLLGSEPRRELGPGVCRYCSRHVFDEGRPAAAGSDVLRLHEFWDHLDLFQEVLFMLTL